VSSCCSPCSKIRPSGAFAEGNTGFTLIELLVVVAILAVLAALLFPLGASALEAGKKAKCLGNLRAIGTGTQAYVADAGVWPELYRFEGSLAVQDTVGAFLYNGGYLKSVEVWDCPSLKNDDAVWQDWLPTPPPFRNFMRFGYAYPKYLYGQRPAAVAAYVKPQHAMYLCGGFHRIHTLSAFNPDVGDACNQCPHRDSLNILCMDGSALNFSRRQWTTTNFFKNHIPDEGVPLAGQGKGTIWRW